MRSDDFETVLDIDGRRKKILRDGHRVRVPMYLRDGKPNPTLSATQQAIAASRRQLSDQELASCRPGFRYGSRSAADRRAMYDAYDKAISDAYLKPRGFGNDPALTSAGSHGPRQEPPEGSPCTKDGWPGTWRRGADGAMVCDIARRADAAKARRARLDPDEDDDDDDDRRSVAQIASDHKQRMARLYDELDRELESAHRTVKP